MTSTIDTQMCEDKQSQQLTCYINDSKNNCNQLFILNPYICNYVINLSKSLKSHDFCSYVLVTLSLYPKFLKKELTEKKDVKNYFKRCHLLSILQLMGMISNSLPQFGKSTGLIKIGKDKNGNKNLCIIDDSTVIDKDTGEIRDSLGPKFNEEYRGYALLESLPYIYKEDILFVLDFMMIELVELLEEIDRNDYEIIDPLLVLQHIIEYCVKYDKTNIVDKLSWEIHDAPYTLTYDEKIKLFSDYDYLYDKWNSGYITDTHGKLRIYILCQYFMKLVKLEKLTI